MQSVQHTDLFRFSSKSPIWGFTTTYFIYTATGRLETVLFATWTSFAVKQEVNVFGRDERN